MVSLLPADISIRRALPGDEEALSLVGQATFLETFAGILDGAAIVDHCRVAHSPAQYRQWLDGYRSAVWLVEVSAGNATIGYSVIAPPNLPLADASRDLELKRIYLLGRFQRSGIGRSLLAQAVEHATSVGAARLLLGVYAGNDSAIAFYRRQGFTHLTDREFQVGSRSYDDRVMSLALNT